VANWRAEPANTPIVEQARVGATSVPMALVFERGLLGEGGWSPLAPENRERTETVLPGGCLGRDVRA
jgi:hypothetical protein